MTAEVAGPGMRSPTPIQITVVHSPACHFCADAEQVLGGLIEIYPIAIEWVEMSSSEGQQLVRAHRAAMSPLVLIDGDFFSAGRLPRKKLVKLLDNRLTRISVQRR